MPELGGDERAPVPALGREFVVSQHVAHERDPQIGRAPEVDAGRGQRRGKAVTGQRRHHDVERIRGVAAVRRGVGQRTDDLLEIPERPRPAVAQDQRRGVGACTGLMDEVDRHAVDVRLVVREPVHGALGPAPVVLGPPILDQLLQIGLVRAVRPFLVGELAGPTRLVQPISQVVQHRVRYVDRKRLFAHVPSLFAVVFHTRTISPVSPCHPSTLSDKYRKPDIELGFLGSASDGPKYCIIACSYREV